MFRFLSCVILTLLLCAQVFGQSSFANTALYKKGDFKINITGYIDGQLGTKQGLDSRHNFYGGFSAYDKYKNVPFSVALRVNKGSNAQESYGGTAIEDAYLRVGDGSTDSDDRFLSFKEESMGRFEFGVTGPISEKLRVSSTEFARGTGGVSGDWFRYVKYNLDSSTTILNPQMPITNGFTTSTYAKPVTGVLQDYYSGSQALKLNVYSPKFNGFLVGIGFTPSLYDRYAIMGLKNSYSSMTKDENNNFNTKNSISSVVHYEKKLSKDLQIVASAILERGTSEKLNKNYNWTPRQNLNAAMFGAAFAFKDWHFGGSYSSYGKSLYFKEDGTANTMKINKDGSLTSFAQSYFYDLGVGYSTKDRGVSLTYFASRYASNQVSTLILSFDKKFMFTETVGMKAYVETGYADIKHANFYDGSGNIISSNKKAGLVFAGLRAMF